MDVVIFTEVIFTKENKRNVETSPSLFSREVYNTLELFEGYLELNNKYLIKTIIKTRSIDIAVPQMECLQNDIIILRLIS